MEEAGDGRRQSRAMIRCNPIAEQQHITGAFQHVSGLLIFV